VIHITAISARRIHIRSYGPFARRRRPKEEFMRTMPQPPSPMADDFADFGIHDHAYVKRVKQRGSKAVSVHAADGSFLGRFPDHDTAFAALRLNDMEPLSVH